MSHTNPMEQLGQNPFEILKNVRCFALDMDGTVYLGDQWISGARQFLKAVEKSGRRYIFMTNNSSKSASDYIRKLKRMGLVADPDSIVTSGEATIAYLMEEHPGKRVYLLGNSSLCREFSQCGIILDDKSPELVVTAFDTELTYQKLCAVCGFLRQGIYYIATHPDINCPVSGGFVPDIGAMHALIEASTGRRPDIIIGKPNGGIVSVMLKKAGCSREQTAVVGDRLYTDVAAGINNGLTGILVLSGETKIQDVTASPIKPDLIFNSLGDIIPFLAI